MIGPGWPRLPAGDRRASRVTGATLLLLLAGFLVLVGTALRRRHRRTEPPPISVAEKVRVEINGWPQGMFITSRDPAKPVLLFLHGGPGMPEFFLARRYPTGLEEEFTVCWWEQRGAGLSYRADLPRETMTVEQFIADTLAVTDYLRERYQQDKIYLLGHSWGSFIGIQAAARAPERYHAYIGVAQVAYQMTSEHRAYEYMLRQYAARGDTRMARRLAAAPVTMTAPLPAAYLAVRDEAMHRLGVGTTRDMTSVVSGIFWPVMQCRDYTFRERIDIWRGKLFSRRSGLWDTMLMTDLSVQVSELAVPVYFCHGIHDYTVAYDVTRAYFSQLTAPVKGFYRFEHSAHSPVFEEPASMRRLLREDVLLGRNGLADAA